MEELKKHIYNEHNGLHYTLVGDCYIPDLQLSEETRPIGVGHGCTKPIWHSIIRSVTTACFCPANSGYIAPCM